MRTETLPDIEKVLIVSTGSLCLYSMMCLPFTATYRRRGWQRCKESAIVRKGSAIVRVWTFRYQRQITLNTSSCTSMMVSNIDPCLKGIWSNFSSRPQPSCTRELHTIHGCDVKRGLKWKAMSDRGLVLLPHARSTWNLGTERGHILSRHHPVKTDLFKAMLH